MEQPSVTLNYNTREKPPIAIADGPANRLYHLFIHLVIKNPFIYNSLRGTISQEMHFQLGTMF